MKTLTYVNMRIILLIVMNKKTISYDFEIAAITAVS